MSSSTTHTSVTKTISLDSETTGVDFFHGARPFFVTSCDEDGEITFWEWAVDPLTRKVKIPKSDLREIQELLDSADRVVLQNSKFDAKALASVGVTLPWDKVEDTLIAGHVLASNQPHDLTSMVLHYLGEDIQPLEIQLEKAVKKARSMVSQARLKVKRAKAKGTEDSLDEDVSRLGQWRIAREGDPILPSADAKTWRYDYWLPRSVYLYGNAPDPLWAFTLREYANADSSHTLPLWFVMERDLHERGYWKIYREQMRLPSIIQDMEYRGVTVSKREAHALKCRLQEESDRAARVCVSIAEGMGYNLTLPKGGNNKSLSTFCFGEKAEVKYGNGDVSKEAYAAITGRGNPQPKRWLDLPVVVRTDKGNPSLDKTAMELYLGTLPDRSKQLIFLQRLSAKRQRDTSITYLNGYERFWLPWSKEDGEWKVLHPNLNQTGSNTLRFSCSNPNEQNISKLGMKCLYCAGRGCVQCDGEGVGNESVRYAFGPAPGREWWSLDAKNIELRIPFYYCGEKVLIDLFERPDDPPFYGSNHLLNFSIVYHDVWEGELGTLCKVEGCKCKGKAVTLETVGPHCKKKFAASQYQWCKNGWFCKQYGGQRALTDTTFRRPGAFDLLDSRLVGLTQLNAQCMHYAEEYGYVQTIPDKSVDPDHGYPIMCQRTEWGKVKPTVPLSYFVQGTAMWFTRRAMVRCQEQLQRWRDQEPGWDGFITMQVHDELDFDFPKRGDPVKDREVEIETGKCPRGRGASNLWRIRILQKLMSQGGDDIGIPIPVGASYHPKNWGEGVDL